MARATIDRLIVNSPYVEPAQHWRYDRTMRLFDPDRAVNRVPWQSQREIVTLAPPGSRCS